MTGSDSVAVLGAGGAPALGAKQPAQEGKPVILASDPQDAGARCQPIFDALGRKTTM